MSSRVTTFTQTGHRVPVEETADLMSVGSESRLTEAELIEPTTSGYLLVAAEVDRRPMFLPSSRVKRELIASVKKQLMDLERDERVLEAVAFDGVLSPTMRGDVLEDHPEIPVARFDLVVLAETSSLETARELEHDWRWKRLMLDVKMASYHTYRLRGRNVRRMGPVDHRAGGVFLFDYFVADRTDVNLAAWQHAAGWFRDETGLENSTVLAPDESNEPGYKLVNHARWDRLRDVVPALIFKRSFRTDVLRHFSANGVAPRPIFYRLA